MADADTPKQTNLQIILDNDEIIEMPFAAPEDAERVAMSAHENGFYYNDGKVVRVFPASRVKECRFEIPC